MSKPWSGNYRAPWHDYTRRCIYLITLLKEDSIPAFGNLSGRTNIPSGTFGSPHIEASGIGRAIKHTLYRFSQIDYRLRLLQYALMPDHLHLLVSVEQPLDEHLGILIARFKTKVNDTCGLKGIFKTGYNDQIIGPGRSLDAVFRYLRENPYRLAVRLEHPEYFSRTERIEIAGHKLCAYGNLALLSNPFREQVVVHRRDDNATRRQNRERWIHTAANGGVLVSPFVAAKEKALRREVEAIGGDIILITHEAFPERFKPAKHDFDLCSAGRLLIVALGRPPATPLSREICLAMNALASDIVNYTF
ncbi:MAG: hypothetical protein U0L83_01650 [Muribaculaceae bacterium]|nr:hypothetical protein [Muribaculaceae bacterium]